MAQTESRAAPGWNIKQPYGPRAVLIVLVGFILLTISAHRLQLDTLAGQVIEFAQTTVGLKESSQIGRGFSRITDTMFPIALAESTPIDEADALDIGPLPAFARIETTVREVSSINPETLEIETTRVETKVLVEPIGYLLFVGSKMLETIEIAIWATLFAVVFSVPLALLSARNYTPHLALYGLARSCVGLMRSVPEFVSALFFVLAFGFGPIAGILALAMHSIGFLGKFYAEDIETADQKPQEALRATGLGQLAVLRVAVLPQVLPSYAGLTLYVLDRNIRMATVIGLVGAGGIGQELKGRYDMFQYDHVGTILLAILVTVLALDQIASRIRKRLI
jgi:phosphonate transport system permease protein